MPKCCYLIKNSAQFLASVNIFQQINGLCVHVTKPCLTNVPDIAILLDCVSFHLFLVLFDLIKCEPMNKQVRKLDLCLENCSALVVLLDHVWFPISSNQYDVLSAETFINTDQFYFRTS